MKKLLIPFLALLLSSCSVTNFYQVYKTSSDGSTSTDDNVVFEDKNCSVKYDLWTEGGNMGFTIYNKTDSDLNVDLTKSFFILNGMSHEYFKNRTLSNSSSSGTTAAYYSRYYGWGAGKSVGKSETTSYVEKPELTIPPRTYIQITEGYAVATERFNSCDMLAFPSRKNIKTLNFDKTNSPFVFYNLISYSVRGENLRMEHKFYVTEITNQPETNMYGMVQSVDCGKKRGSYREFKKEGADRFYVRYSH